MLDRLSDVLKCEVCTGELEVDTVATVDDYSVIMSTKVSNISDKLDEIIGRYLVYRCSSCGQIYKYTYKDLEYLLRKKLTERMLLLIVRGQIINSNSLQDKFLIYCGKCHGFDGQGSCTKSIFEKCGIKRFPANEL